MRINNKVEAARFRRSMAELERLQREASDKEDRYWSQFETPKSRAAKKRQEESEKRAEAAARRAEVRRLAKEEDKELDNALSKKKATTKKVTEAELLKVKDGEAAVLARKRMVTEREYESVVSVSNTNHESVIEASTIEEAIAQLTGQDAHYWPDDRVSEKRCFNDGFRARSLALDFKLFRLGIA